LITLGDARIPVQNISYWQAYYYDLENRTVNFGAKCVKIHMKDQTTITTDIPFDQFAPVYYTALAEYERK
jgi:hypothetical protein